MRRGGEGRRRGRKEGYTRRGEGEEAKEWGGGGRVVKARSTNGRVEVQSTGTHTHIRNGGGGNNSIFLRVKLLFCCFCSGRPGTVAFLVPPGTEEREVERLFNAGGVSD